MAKALIGYLNSDLRTPARLVPRTVGCAPGWASSRPSFSASGGERPLTAARGLALIESGLQAMQEMQPA